MSETDGGNLMALPLWLIVETVASMIAVGALVLIWWPTYVLVQFSEMDGIDRLASNATRMVLFLIVIGYLLTAVQVLSWMSLAAALVLLRLGVPRPLASAEGSVTNTKLSGRLMAELNELAALPARLWRRGPRRSAEAGGKRRGRWSWYAAVATAGTAAVVAVATWMRFWQNWAHAALPYSDAYVLLAWMKDIQLGRLFPDGIYPKGYLLVMAEWSQLSATNPVVLEKFFGPAVGVAMVLTAGYTAYRFSGKVAPGIIAMLCYGSLTFLFPYTVDRQAASLAQEFGSVFALPTAYFVYQSWTHPSQRGWRWTAISLLAVAGLVHPIPLLNAAIAAVAGTLGGWMAAGIDRRLLGWYLKWVPLTAVLVALPIVLPRALGIPLYGSSAAFLVSSAAVPAPPLTTVAAVAAGACAALFLLHLLRRRDGAVIAVPLVALIALAGALLIQQLPRFGLQSALLSQRSGNFVAFTEALGLAMAWWLLEEMVAWVTSSRRAAWISLVLAIAVSIGAWRTFPPRPLTPYSMTSDAFVAAYVDIAVSQPANSWLAVSNDLGYSFALGQGFQMDAPLFVSHVPPTIAAAWPRYAPGGGAPSYPIGQREIFLFVNHRYHVANLGTAGLAYARADRQDTLLIERWLRAWEAHHAAPKVFFSSPQLTVYELQEG
ncbi:MAG: hypothetical protein ACYCOS_00880 [Sulfobacillus sp.]